MQQLTAPFTLESGYTEVEITAYGTFTQGIRGSRSALGVQEEPDDDDEVTIKGIEMNGKSVEICDVCHLFGYTEQEMTQRVIEELTAVIGDEEVYF